MPLPKILKLPNPCTSERQKKIKWPRTPDIIAQVWAFPTWAHLLIVIEFRNQLSQDQHMTWRRPQLFSKLKHSLFPKKLKALWQTSGIYMMMNREVHSNTKSSKSLLTIPCLLSQTGCLTATSIPNRYTGYFSTNFVHKTFQTTNLSKPYPWAKQSNSS